MTNFERSPERCLEAGVKLIQRRAALVGTLAIAATYTLSGCKDKTKPSVPPAKPPSGEDLLRATMFLEGPLVQKIPELNQLRTSSLVSDMTPDEIAAAGQVRDSLIKELKAKDGAFLDRFQQDMTSGDRAKVSAGLQEAAKLIRAAAEWRDPELGKFLKEHDASLRSFAKRGVELMNDKQPNFGELSKKIGTLGTTDPAAEEKLLDVNRRSFSALHGGGPEPMRPPPDTDHSVIVIVLTVIVIVVTIALATPAEPGTLYHEALVDSIAKQFKS